MIRLSAALLRSIAFGAVIFAAASAAHAQAEAVVCRAGNGNFEARFPSGVTLQVGAARKEGLATRSCEGALLWDKGKLTVASGVAQVDVDAFGIDVGLGTPVATLQVKKAETDCCVALQIYSLRKPPKLLRTINGGSFFRTADTDLDSQIEIWSGDAAALAGFESPDLDKPELAPPVVLRFERGRLMDVSSEFQNYFDNRIAKLRSTLDPGDLREFKASNGRLPPTAYFSREDLQRSERLASTKAKILQIVWAYLYSGRESEAWANLVELWPPADQERIRRAIGSARALGIHSQVDGVSDKSSSGAERRGEIVDARTLRTGQSDMKIAGRRPDEKGSDITLPTAIWVGHEVPSGQGETLNGAGLLLDLVLDSAGKVRAAESDDPRFDGSLRNSTTLWRFIPALRQGRPVASRVYFIVSPKE